MPIFLMLNDEIFDDLIILEKHFKKTKSEIIEQLIVNYIKMNNDIIQDKKFLIVCEKCGEKLISDKFSQEFGDWCPNEKCEKC